MKMILCFYYASVFKYGNCSSIKLTLYSLDKPHLVLKYFFNILLLFVWDSRV